MKQRVVVIGNSYSTRLGIIRSVAQIGCEVVVIPIAYYKHIKPTKPIDCFSKFVSAIFFFDRSEGEDGLVRLLMEKCVVDDPKAIIIPTSDFSAHAVDNEVLMKNFHIPHIHNKIGSIGFWMNKENQKNQAIKIGLNVAKSIVVELYNDEYEIPTNITYPCFTKPLSSIGGGKTCLMRCNNIDDLKKVLDVANKQNITNVLVEDYINIEKEYAVLGFSDGQNVVIPGIITFTKGSECHTGVALSGKVSPIKGFEKLVEQFICLIKSIGFIGLFDIDFFESKGKFYFGELNLRCGASGYVLYKMGVNLPCMLIKAFRKENIENIQNKILGSSTFLNEKICIDDWLAGKLSTISIIRQMHSAGILFVKDTNDFGPQNELNKIIFKNSFSIKRIIKYIIN